MKILFVSSFATSSASFSKLDSRMFLFQIKVFGRNIRETTQPRYFIKVTACPSFTQLRVIRQINQNQNGKCYKDPAVSPYLSLLGILYWHLLTIFFNTLIVTQLLNREISSVGILMAVLFTELGGVFRTLSNIYDGAFFLRK